MPTKFPADYGGRAFETAGGHRMIGFAVSLETIILTAFQVSTPYRMALPPGLPKAKYDFFASFPKNSPEALQSLIQSQFKLSARFEDVQTNVFYLRVKNSGATGLKRSQTRTGSTQVNNGNLKMHRESMASFTAELEDSFIHAPVFDQTHLDGEYDFQLTWDPSNPDALNQALSDQLGLELVPGTDFVRLLVVEQAGR